ncbi:heavy metal translocating P-type ATPase, partial [Methylomonas sp. WSC-6]|nr:heavy metal translocating P-type ATPase [Methylomonas sp. WSC-6]
MAATWFAKLEPVHRSRGRVRFRYRCRTATSFEPRQIARAIEAVKGVLAVKVNPSICALVVEYETAVTDADSLANTILTLPPPADPMP